MSAVEGNRLGSHYLGIHFNRQFFCCKPFLGVDAIYRFFSCEEGACCNRNLAEDRKEHEKERNDLDKRTKVLKAEERRVNNIVSVAAPLLSQMA